MAALDVSIQAQAIRVLNQSREQTGVAFVFVSHDLGVVRYSPIESWFDDVVSKAESGFGQQRSALNLPSPDLKLMPCSSDY